jgi:aryl-alcohol dehydrogenase-like predicted oxidoreductase
LADLPRRTLGRTGLEVTVLSYGAMELRGSGGNPVSEERAGRILNAALDAGINLIDTSIDYGPSEDYIGRSISHRRDEYVLATKCGCPLGGVPRPLRGGLASRLRRGLGDTAAGALLRALLHRGLGLRGDGHVFTRANIVAGLEQSLRRLQTDHVDILQVHHTPSRAELEQFGTVEAMLDLKRQGKVRFIGASTSPAYAAEHLAMGVFDVIQLPYSAFDPALEPEVSAAAAAGTGTLIRGGGGHGRGGERDPEISRLWQRAGLAELTGGMSRFEFNIRYTLGNPDVATLLSGTMNPAHLQENVLAAIGGPLPREMHEAARHAIAAIKTNA